MLDVLFLVASAHECFIIPIGIRQQQRWIQLDMIFRNPAKYFYLRYSRVGCHKNKTNACENSHQLCTKKLMRPYVQLRHVAVHKAAPLKMWCSDIARGLISGTVFFLEGDCSSKRMNNKFNEETMWCDTFFLFILVWNELPDCLKSYGHRTRILTRKKNLVQFGDVHVLAKFRIVWWKF